MSDIKLAKLQKSIAAYSEGCSAVSRTSTGIDNTFSAKGGMLTRDEYSKSNYDSARPNERVPTDFLNSLIFCNDSYYNVAIVRNVIDIMSDFCIKGIDWSHANRATQAFYREWFRTVDGIDVSERFCNYLIRLGNVAIAPEKSKIPEGIASNWKKTRGDTFKDIKVNNLEIPSSYNFIDITALQPVIDQNTVGLKNRTYRIASSGGLISSFTNYNLSFRTQDSNTSNFSGTLFQSLPYSIKKKVVDNSGNVIIKEGKDILVYHYRKDHWDTWARPIILSIAEPLIMLKKMHLADMSALDGVISNVRLWRIGYIDQTNVLNSIIPSADMLTLFSNMLRNNIAGGVLDIVWGPDLDFKESSSNAHQFLFPEKYTQLMSEIYDGLGINPSLAGGANGGNSGLTNNAISMKVLVERLAYVRNKLIHFWNGQADIVQKAMGFPSAARVEFDDAIFSDEIAYKKLLVDIYDRNIISAESVREEFNLVDRIESSRVNREVKKREKGTVPAKSGQFHDPMIKDKLKSDLIKTGNLDGDHMDVDVNKDEVYSKNPGGRPTGAKDTGKRATKQGVTKKVVASSFIETHVWARESLDKISSIIGDSYLQEKAKANFRQLSDDESNEFEDLKLSVLMGIEPFSPVEINTVSASISNIKSTHQERVIRDTLLMELSGKIKRILTIDDKRIASAAAYAISKISENNDEN